MPLLPSSSASEVLPPFIDVVAYVDPALGEAYREQLIEELRSLNAHTIQDISNWSNLTHYVTDNWHCNVPAEYRRSSSNNGHVVNIVKPLWVEQILRHNKRYRYMRYKRSKQLTCTTNYSEKFFSPDNSLFFSGYRIYFSNIPLEDDLVALSGAVLALGGDYIADQKYSADVTHIACVHGVVDKAARTLLDNARHDVRVVHVAWVLDSAQTGRLLDETQFYIGTTSNMWDHTDQEREFRFSAQYIPVPTTFFLKGFSLYLHEDINVNDDALIVQRLREAGAHILSSSNIDEVFNSLSSNTTILVFQHAYGHLYLKAHQAKCSIASMYWLYWVLWHQAYSDPRGRLLNYPFPKGICKDKHKKIMISITNYTGFAREYLKALVPLLGARYSGDLTGLCTHLITPAARGEKFKQGVRWKTTRVVNHFWLEDSIANLTFMDENDPRYTYVPAVEEDRNLGCVASTGISESTIAQIAEFTKSKLDRDVQRNQRQLASLIEGQGFLAAGIETMDRHRPAATKARQSIQEKLDLLKGLPADERRRVEATWLIGDDGELDGEFQPRDEYTDATTKSQSVITSQSTQDLLDVHSISPDRDFYMLMHYSPPASINSDDILPELTTMTRAHSHNTPTPATSVVELTEISGSPKVIIAFTQTKTATPQELQILHSMGGALAIQDANFTYLIATRIVKTEKFLRAVICGAEIVTRDWLEQSIAQHTFADTNQFQLKDRKVEIRYRFSLLNAIRVARTQKLLHNCLVTATPAVLATRNLPKSTLERLVASAGGQVVKHPVSRQMLMARDGVTQNDIRLIVLSVDCDRHEYMRYHAWQMPGVVNVFQYGYLSLILLRQDITDIDHTTLN